METELNPLVNENRQSVANSNHVIHIPVEDHERISSMKDKLKNEKPKLLLESAGKTTCCIFRVLNSLVQVNEKAYHPQIVSVGPYHYGKEQLQMIQEHKWRFLGSVLARLDQHGLDLSDLFAVVAPREAEIRECYSENTENCSSHQLVEMMVLDGCFIIELLCIIGGLATPLDLDDPIFNRTWMLCFLMRDLLRLENQIPFFVLESLFEIIRVTFEENSCTLTELALGFFNNVIERREEVVKEFKQFKGKHLLDLLRTTFVPQSEDEKTVFSPDDRYLQPVQPVRKLRLSGIKFEPKKADGFLDISFRRGTLRIPPLTVDDMTTSFLLNCVAFEQCYKHCSKHMTSYVIFMGCLINSPADAAYLSDNQMVENCFGTDEQVAKFFNDVGKDVSFDIERSNLAKLFVDVNRYYRNDFNRKWAGFKHKYFESPWSFISALAALVILLLTLLQAFFAVLAYAKPPKP